ncbi:MAG: hypothetical protein LBO20_00890 [Bifidobacteriaceae bacterium]|nr:hypothetical protein [Bifidobacteriaceae bacterium]
MRKRLAVVILVAISLTAAGCVGRGAGPSAEPDPLAGVEWVDGDPPSLEFSKPFDFDQKSAWRLAKPGDGAVVKVGDEVELSFVIVSGEDGSVVTSTYRQDADPFYYLMMDKVPDGDYLWPAIKGQTVGSQVIVAFSQPQSQGQSPSAPGSASPAPTAAFLGAVTIVSARQAAGLDESAQPGEATPTT